jgi:uncharacterized membrane protein YedE/YeeE
MPALLAFGLVLVFIAGLIAGAAGYAWWHRRPPAPGRVRGNRRHPPA